MWWDSLKRWGRGKKDANVIEYIFFKLLDWYLWLGLSHEVMDLVGNYKDCNAKINSYSKFLV
jgi:hypothetical protein